MGGPRFGFCFFYFWGFRAERRCLLLQGSDFFFFSSLVVLVVLPRFVALSLSLASLSSAIVAWCGLLLLLLLLLLLFFNCSAN
jgi:hypothetical protein